MAGELAFDLDRNAVRIKAASSGFGREEANRLIVLLLLELVEKVEDLTHAVLEAGEE